jgi:[protein-PII] uridylyltransferase
LDPAGVFRASMPERYRESFDGVAIREHAAIVARRADAPAHVEIWRRLPRGRAIACVVADDRPGLLSLISAALVVQSLDVVSAQAYTRAVPGSESAEAVDFLWLRRDAELPLPIRSNDAVQIVEVLSGLISGKLTMETVMRRARQPSSPPAGASTRVAFNETADASLSVLTVETFDRPGLLLAITLALFRARIQIVGSEASTTNGRVVDRFTLVELDGSPIQKHRRGAVQTAVLAAIDTLSQRTSV